MHARDYCFVLSNLMKISYAHYSCISHYSYGGELKFYGFCSTFVILVFITRFRKNLHSIMISPVNTGGSSILVLEGFLFFTSATHKRNNRDFSPLRAPKFPCMYEIAHQRSSVNYAYLLQSPFQLTVEFVSTFYFACLHQYVHGQIQERDRMTAALWMCCF